MSEATYEEYQRDQYGTSGGYDGPPVPAGYFPPEFRLPVAQTYQPPIGIPVPEIFPTVRVVPPAASTGDSADEADEDSALPEDWIEVVDPYFYPSRTVYESAPGGIYETNRAPTDWDRVYDEYVVLNAPEPVIEEPDVPFHSSVIDWGATILGGVLDPVGIGDWVRDTYLPPAALTGGVTGLPSLGQQTMLAGPPAVQGAVVSNGGCPPHGPKYAKICLATREITPLRRRRRRRLLTSSDIKDLSALKSIVGGAALQAAVVQAVRR